MKITQANLSKLIPRMVNMFLMRHVNIQKCEVPEILLEMQNTINKKNSREDHEGQRENFLSLFEHIAFCAQMEGVNLHREIIWKYPGVCSYCVKPVCECKDLLFRPNKQPDEIMNPFRLRAMKLSTHVWVEGNHCLYPCDPDNLKSLGKLWRHFLSEGCEFSSAYLRKQRGATHNLGEELGDLFEKAVNLCAPLKIPILDLWNMRYS